MLLKRLVCLLLIMSAVPVCAGETLVWPLDLDTRYLTSNFMERRPGRWHAGLDLKTRSRPGFAVRAVQDGWISRVRAEAGAYGRAVYVTHPSGQTTVYAHLERFSDRILAQVAADRARSGRYRVRLSFPAGRLPVTAGEVLGLSGQSGTLGPHLHFELRAANQSPLNPLDWGFAVPDTFSPLITSITAHPVGRSGRCPDSLLIAVGLVDPGGLPTATAPLRITGPVAFSAAITDRSDIRGHRLEPWLIEVLLDGELVYRCRNESFSFDRNSVQRLEWCDIEGHDGETILREHWLFRRDGVELPGRQGEPWHLGRDGQGLAAGRHVLEIMAADRAGGRTRVTVPLQVVACAEPPSPLERGGTATKAWATVAAHLDDGAGNRLGAFFELHSAGPGAAQRRVLDPVAGDPVLVPTVLWTIPGVPVGAVESAVPELEPLAWGAEFLAADWPLDGALRIEVAAPPTAANVWIFRWDEGQWRRVGPLLSQDGTAFFMLTDRGLHAAFSDKRGPWIDPAQLVVTPRPPGNVAGVTLPRWTTVPVAIVDGGTGVDPAIIAVTLDDVPLIVEPDLPRKRVLVTVPDRTAPGAHTLYIEAADRAGNTSRRRLEVRCGPAEIR